AVFLIGPSVQDISEQRPLNATCLVTGYNLKAFSITWKIDGKKQTAKIKTEKHLTNLNGTETMRSIMELTEDMWNKLKLVSCEVKHPCIDKPQTAEIKRTGEPTVKLLLSPTESKSENTPQNLVCSVSGFSPTIKWSSQDQPRKSKTERRAMGSDGRFIVTSELEVPRGEWDRGDVFQCEVEDPFLPNGIKHNISRCSVLQSSPKNAAVFLIGPSIQDISEQRPLNATCLVTGYNLKAFSITWKIDRKKQTDKIRTEITLKNPNGTETMRSIMELTEYTWNKLKLVSCEVKHPCIDKPQTAETKRTGFNPKQPTVVVRRSPRDNPGSDRAELECLLTGFSPSDIYVKWQVKNVDVPESQYMNEPVISENGKTRFSMVSRIYIHENQWSHLKSYKCVVNQGNGAQQFPESDANLTAKHAHNFNCHPILQKLLQKMTIQDKQYIYKDLTVTCLVIGYNLKDFSISWTVSGSLSTSSGKTQPVVNTNGTESMNSSLMVKAEEWNTYKQITCEVSHPCSDQTQKLQIAKFKDFSNPKQPTIQIFEPSESDLQNSDKAILVCLVSGFFPAEIFVKWKLNGTELSTSLYTNSPATKDPQHNTYSMDSKLQIPKSDWYKGLYACDVSHE
uniref:Ig-like domain-containing protein n=1 Tax=Lepisosteus oculatus TaxID=7918 RepID=W5LZU1_LEPOC